MIENFKKREKKRKNTSSLNHTSLFDPLDESHRRSEVIVNANLDLDWYKIVQSGSCFADHVCSQVKHSSQQKPVPSQKFDLMSAIICRRSKHPLLFSQGTQ
jgi:hypothetical protein